MSVPAAKLSALVEEARAARDGDAPDDDSVDDDEAEPAPVASNQEGA